MIECTAVSSERPVRQGERTNDRTKTEWNKKCAIFSDFSLPCVFFFLESLGASIFFLVSAPQIFQMRKCDFPSVNE